MPTTRVTFPNLRGQTLVGLLEKPDASTGKLPAVVLCHGFTGFKEVKYLVRLAQALRDAGFACLRFDYADGIGESDGSCEDMLLTHQIEDTFAAINFLEADPNVDGQRIGLAGHSLGGVACIAVAASDTRVKALMTIAAPAHPDLQHLFEPDMVKRWKRQGVADIPLYPKGHVRVRYNFLEDFRKYDATEIIRQVRVPALFVQGARDDVVPPRNTQALYDNAGGPRKLELVPGAEHLFLDNASIQHMVRTGVEWFRQRLARVLAPHPRAVLDSERPIYPTPRRHTMEAEVKQGTEAKITQEMVNELLAVKGKEFSTKGQWNAEAGKDSIRHWVEGIGDMNPLYQDEEYGKKTRFGGVTAPFSFLLSCEGRAGRVGMPGIHALHAGVRFVNYKPIRAGETIVTTGGLHDLVEKKSSSFAGRTFIQTWFKNFRNQKGDLLSTLYEFFVRSERKTASDKGKYQGVTKHKWTEAELQEIWKGIEAEEVRGATPRYWEDVKVGDDLRPVVKGPLTMSDVVAFKMGWGSQLVHHIRANEVRYWMMKRHPGIPIRNKLNVPDCPEAVHMDDDFAIRIGFPGWYDYGPQRVSWVANIVTNWVGDDGWVKEFYAEVRRPNIEGDVQWCKGKVTRKWVEGNEHLVACDVWAENQRGEITAPGNSVVVLPSRG